MKYVYIDLESIPEEWLKKAQKALEEAAGEVDATKRDELISSKSGIWGELKPVLEGVNDNKCWYTEAREAVSYYQVDHYRPKAKYPWLAFEWRNFRLSGGKPNRKKWDKFPLVDEGSRVSVWDAPFNGEVPLMLDPTDPNDPPLLTFSDDGMPACAKPEDEDVCKRVNFTIEALGLDSAVLTEERRDKWRKCHEKLSKLSSRLEQKRQQANSDAVEHIKDLSQDLMDLFDPKSEYTATATAAKGRFPNGDLLLELARKLAAHNDGGVA